MCDVKVQQGDSTMILSTAKVAIKQTVSGGSPYPPRSQGDEISLLKQSSLFRILGEIEARRNGNPTISLSAFSRWSGEKVSVAKIQRYKASTTRRETNGAVAPTLAQRDVEFYETSADSAKICKYAIKRKLGRAARRRRHFRCSRLSRSHLLVPLRREIPARATPVAFTDSTAPTAFEDKDSRGLQFLWTGTAFRASAIRRLFEIRPGIVFKRAAFTREEREREREIEYSGILER